MYIHVQQLTSNVHVFRFNQILQEANMPSLQTFVCTCHHHVGQSMYTSGPRHLSEQVAPARTPAPPPWESQKHDTLASVIFTNNASKVTLSLAPIRGPLTDV